MPDKCFFDTNLWVYLKAQNQSPDDLRKQQVVSQLTIDRWRRVFPHADAGSSLEILA
jgi:predicted nucleic acid-binding protein